MDLIGDKKINGQKVSTPQGYTKHHSRQQARALTRQITRSLKQDRKDRVVAAGAEIEACLENHDLQGAWNVARRRC